MKIITIRRGIVLVCFGLIASIGFSSFNKNQKTIWGQNLLDSLTESQKRETQNSLKGLKIHPDLEITTFATEPMLQNPTNIDLDSKGRIWV